MIVQGTVEDFDGEVGLGSVSGPDGTRFRFHCTAITDGSRSIDVGRRVAFVVGAAGPGTWEAASVTPITIDGPPPAS